MHIRYDRHCKSTRSKVYKVWYVTEVYTNRYLAEKKLSKAIPHLQTDISLEQSFNEFTRLATKTKHINEYHHCRDYTLFWVIFFIFSI